MGMEVVSILLHRNTEKIFVDKIVASFLEIDSVTKSVATAD